VMVFEMGKRLESTRHSRPPLKRACGDCSSNSYLCVCGGSFTPWSGVTGFSGGNAPRAKYTSFVGNPSKADSGSPKFFARSAFGVWPSQSVMLKVPNSEK
jgi:hypothetical protein